MRKVNKENVTDGEFRQYEDAWYNVDGLKWFSTNASGDPVLVMDTRRNVLVGRARLTLPGEEDGPAISLTLGDMAVLAVGFGVKPNKLPKRPNLSQPVTVSKYMQAIAGAIEKAKSTVTANVRNNWVVEVKEAQIPPSYYYFVVTGLFPFENAGSKDNPVWIPKPRDGQYGAWYGVRFRIVAGEGGAETPYEGAEWSEQHNYAATVYEDEGELEMGFATTSEGQFTAAGDRMCDLMEFSAPDIMGFSYGDFADPDNVLPEWNTLLETATHVLKASLITRGGKGKNKHQTVISFGSLEPVQGYAVQTQPQYEAPGMGVNRTAVFGLLTELLNMVSVNEHKEPAFTGKGNALTDAGKTMVKKYFGPVADRFSTKKLGEFTVDDIGVGLTALLENAEGEFISSFRERVDEMFAPPQPAPKQTVDNDDEDIPF